MSEAEAPGAGTTPPPQFVDEKIIFHCPRGHRLVVAAKYAGKHGRCDRKGCNAPVTIPVPPLDPAHAGDVPELDLEPVEAADVVAPAVEEPLLAPPVFVKPVVATPVVGTPEVVPVVGPTADTTSAAPMASPGGQAAAPSPVTPAEPEAHGWGFIDDSEAESRDAVGVSEAGASGGRPDGHMGDGFDNPTARLVARLWQERDHGGIVELHLVSGSVVLPEWYEPTWSRGTHGLFASQAPDGTMTLTAVAWDAIQKVVVRQVRDLPDGMFE